MRHETQGIISTFAADVLDIMLKNEVASKRYEDNSESKLEGIPYETWGIFRDQSSLHVMEVM
jgi:hypothetical protein